MTDEERIKDLERRVAQLEDILTRLEFCGDGLFCRTGWDKYGNTTRTDLGCYIQHNCKFGKDKSNG